MKKDLADYLNTKRDLETIMYDEGDSFMYHLSHWPEVLERWAAYKETKKKSALTMDEVTKALEANEGGKAVVKQIEEEADPKNKEATAEEILDVDTKTRFVLQALDGPITYGKELKQEINDVEKEVFGTIGSELLAEDEMSDIEKRALTAIGAKIFDMLFLR